MKTNFQEVVRYIDLNEGVRWTLGHYNTIDEAEAKLMECAQAAKKYYEMHTGDKGPAYGLQGKNPISLYRDGCVLRIYWTDCDDFPYPDDENEDE